MVVDDVVSSSAAPNQEQAAAAAEDEKIVQNDQEIEAKHEQEPQHKSIHAEALEA